MNERPNLLVVCGRNKRRSRTAEYIFKNDSRFSIRSVGLSPRSERQLQEKDLEWADLIAVMEDEHVYRIAAAYRHVDLPIIEMLGIDDEYEYLDPELVSILTQKINELMAEEYGI